MSEYKETITTRSDAGIDDTGAQVQQKTRSVDTKSSASGQFVAGNIVWFIVGLVEILLAFRFILKLFGANPSSSFVNFIYSITGVLTIPFDSIFGVAKASSNNIQSVFEPSILVAAAVYALIGWGIVKLLNINHTT